MIINLKIIKDYASPDIYKKGVRLYKKNLVELKKLEMESFTAEVKDDITYQVQVQQEGKSFISSCSCPSWVTCEHVEAALLAAKEWYENNRDKLIFEQTHPDWQDFFEKLFDYPAPAGPSRKINQKWKIIFIIKFDKESWSITPQKTYIKKDGTMGRFANIGEFDSTSNEILYSENDPVIISYLQKMEQRNNSFYNHRYYGNVHKYDISTYHFKYGSRLGPFFDFLQQSSIFISLNPGKMSPIEYSQKNCNIKFEFVEQDDFYQLVPSFIVHKTKQVINTDFSILSEMPVWLIKDQMLYKVKNLELAGLLLPFTKDNIDLRIPKNEFSVFLEKFYPQLFKFGSLPLPQSVSVLKKSEIKNKVLCLSEGDDYLEIALKLDYDGHEIDYQNKQKSVFQKEKNDIVLIQRDKKSEKEIWNYLLSTGLKTSPKGNLRVIDSKALKWMFKNINRLKDENYLIKGLEDLHRYKIRTGKPHVKVAVSTKIDWFDLNLEIDIEGVKLSLKELRAAVRQNKKIVRLEDNSIAQIPEEWFKKFRHLFNFTEIENDNIKVAKYHVTLIDLLFEDANSKNMDVEFKKNLKKLRDFKGINSHIIPQNIKSVLRDYQKAGYDWLYFLKDYSFGGCLADDMGLGKTLQTLALLLKEKISGNKIPSLIVCPTSVVFNWENEVKKFTPQLNILLHTGNYRDRNTDNLKNYDIIITSYGIMRRDIAFLKDFTFFYTILDESQKIKNPQSQTSKASRILKSKYRLVLTGTPVENNTIELWSQFSYLNPGLLGSLNYFKKAFANPIEKRQDKEASDLLKQIVFPFILRRTKENVAPELPPKIEQTIYCVMNDKQNRLYQHWKNHYRSVILNKIDMVGINKARMNILEGLVKLRQIACHPFLVDHGVIEDSGKFEFLKEIIDEIVSENHKVLLFSQFVRMLRLIQNYLNENNIDYVYLDGNTKNRQECVNRFQTEKDVKIFLISLKAGGTGLNLTAADYVIHYDPWWNPAVEVQATDRAHRIGQDKKLFVYRLITKNSVEEKMLELQAKKEKLVSDLISTDTGFFKNLTRENIENLFS
ncbi:SNF2 helicase associated domain-containing protein [candidate division KSB1 bacterium]|nr:SNF2 helicase associated domain-containing protein [candidate division KSB1 bacterium]